MSTLAKGLNKNLSDSHDERTQSEHDLIKLARLLYQKTCEALDRADQDDNELSLVLSDGADNLDAMISGLDRIREARK
jgi:hypothetical protein